MREQEDNAIVNKTRLFDVFTHAIIEKHRSSARPGAADANRNWGLFNILSLAFAIGSIGIIVASLTFASSALISLAIASAIAAIALGIVSRRRTPLRGFGIAGIVIGAIDILVSAGLVLIALTWGK